MKDFMKDQFLKLFSARFVCDAVCFPVLKVPCPFMVHGCEVDKLQRMDLDAHMRDTTTRHLELLCKKV